MANEIPTSAIGTRVFSGARARFFFNGQQIAYATGVDGSEEIQMEPVDTLDDIQTKEHCPVGYRVSLSCSIFRTVSNGPSTDLSPGSLKQQGLFPKFGARGEKILQMEGVDVFIQDRNTGKVMYLFTDVKPSSQNFSIGARQITGQNVTFVTTRLLDESEI